MEGIDPREAAFAIGKIDDGFVFEDFCKRFLASILGYEFIPVGGIKDKGIDALQHVSLRKDNICFIYQMSIEKNPEGKIEDTIVKLAANKVAFTCLTYVTNQAVKSVDSCRVPPLLAANWPGNSARNCMS
jgi:hypothetical protein